MSVVKVIISIIFVLLMSGIAQALDFFPAKLKDKPSEKLIIYSSMDINFIRDIIHEFQNIYQTVEIEYHDLQTFDIYEKVVEETDLSGKTADFVFSSAMDLQVKLVNDGYAQRISLPQSSTIPNFAKWRNMVFGLTYEPAVIVYNKKWFRRKEVPQTHADLTKFINANAKILHSKVATYDIERSGLGFFFMSQDLSYNSNIWELVKAMGDVSVRLYSNSSAILQRVASGKFVLGYNILGSYATSYAKKQPKLGVIIPKDYTIMMTRLGLVPKFAQNSELGKLFLRFLSSEKGQSLLQQKTNMLSLEDTRKSTKYRYVRIGPGLVVYQDQLKRNRLIRKWNHTLKSK